MAISKLTVGGVEIPSVKSVTYHETVNGGVDLRPGCVGSAYIEAEVYGTQADAVSPGAAVSYYIVDADSTETLIGVFNAEPVVKTKNTYKLVAYDNAYKLNVDFSAWLRDHQSDFPMTRAALVAAACTVAGVVNATPNWTGSVQTVEAFYADGLTCRDILSYAAELSGYFVRCHADGQLYFEWYTATPGTRIYPSSGEEESETRYAYKQDGLNYANYTVPAIDGVAAHPSGEDDVAYIYPSTPSGDNLLHIRNNILLMGATAAVYNAAAQMIYTQMTAVGAYVPATTQMFISECPYESGETVLVTDIQGVSFKTLVMSKTVTASGVTLESTGNEAQDAGYENTQKALVQLASDVVRISKLKVSYADIDQAIINYLTANDVTAQNLTIVDAEGNVLATFNANGITLGQADEAHAELDYNSFELLDKDGNTFLSVGDMRSLSGTAQLTEYGTIPLVDRDVYATQFAISEVISVYLDGVIVQPSDYYAQDGKLHFNTAPEWKTPIEVEYLTTDPVYHYDIGSRDTSNGTGAWSVASGENAIASGAHSTVSGGYNNTATRARATVCGGTVNTASGLESVVSGGRKNVASGTESTVCGGYYNEASGDYSSVGGGRFNKATNVSQIVVGEYNAEDPLSLFPNSRGTYVEIVGNGTADNARSNARTLDWDGNEWIAGRYISGPNAAHSTTPPFETTINNAPESGDAAPSGNVWGAIIGARDKGGALRSYVRHYTLNTGEQGIQIETRRYLSSTVYNGLMLGIDANGTPIVTLSDTTAWLKALGLAYSPGDVLTQADLNNYAQFAGVWLGTTDLRFTIPTRKSCVGLNATASGGFYWRGGGKAASVTIDNTMTVYCYCSEVGVSVRVLFSSEPTNAYRYAATVSLQNNFTITFG